MEELVVLRESSVNSRRAASVHMFHTGDAGFHFKGQKGVFSPLCSQNLHQVIFSLQIERSIFFQLQCQNVKEWV